VAAADPKQVRHSELADAPSERWAPPGCLASRREADLEWWPSPPDQPAASAGRRAWDGVPAGSAAAAASPAAMRRLQASLAAGRRSVEGEREFREIVFRRSRVQLLQRPYARPPAALRASPCSGRSGSCAPGLRASDRDPYWARQLASGRARRSPCPEAPCPVETAPEETSPGNLQSALEVPYLAGLEDQLQGPANRCSWIGPVCRVCPASPEHLDPLAAPPLFDGPALPSRCGSGK
jgi:hypothetical protein